MPINPEREAAFGFFLQLFIHISCFCYDGKTVVGSPAETAQCRPVVSPSLLRYGRADDKKACEHGDPRSRRGEVGVVEHLSRFHNGSLKALECAALLQTGDPSSRPSVIQTTAPQRAR